MIKLSTRVLCGALSLCVAISTVTAAFADESVVPVRLDPDKIAGLGLTAIPPDAYKDILVGGELNMRVATLFEGKELACPSSSRRRPKRSPHAADRCR